MSKVVIFLDIDGVLNDHRPLESRYSGTKPSCVSQFNRILGTIPEAKIVISSAWRYLILRGDMTLKGFEMLLLTHGVNCHGRVIGHTRADGPIDDEPHHHDEPERWRMNSLSWRVCQIDEYILNNDVTKFVIIDDLPLASGSLVQTDGLRGLTFADANEVIRILQR